MIFLDLGSNKNKYCQGDVKGISPIYHSKNWNHTTSPTKFHSYDILNTFALPSFDLKVAESAPK
jgi:hypothetical protein